MSEVNQLIEPEIWVEYHRQCSWLCQDGRRVYATAEMPGALALLPARLRFDKETNEIVYEYLM